MSPTAGVINKPVGYSQYNDLTAVRRLSDTPSHGNAMPSSVIRALIQAEGADVRWTDDGTDPTATLGMIIKDGVVLEYEGNLETIRFFQSAAGAKLNVSYYKY